jgi:methylenetetrahydrofolate reductase (NADPH)
VRESLGFAALKRGLENPCFEIIPVKGVEQKANRIPSGADVAITCSPEKGMPATLALTRHLSHRAFTLIPHIAARMVVDDGHLREILGELDELGIRRIFVVGGDAEQPVGKFDSSLQLLKVMSNLDHGVEVVGIGAYPEGHPLIDDPVLLRFLLDKQPFAAYMVTQMCFDPAVIAGWLRRVRGEGVDLPVRIGVPGVARRSELLRIALKIGVGPSIRFLKSSTGLLERMMAPGGYSPDSLLLALAPYFDAHPWDIEGVHFYTFNEIERTERWRAEMLDRLSRGEGASP